MRATSTLSLAAGRAFTHCLCLNQRGRRPRWAGGKFALLWKTRMRLCASAGLALARGSGSRLLQDAQVVARGPGGVQPEGLAAGVVAIDEDVALGNVLPRVFGVHFSCKSVTGPSRPEGCGCGVSFLCDALMRMFVFVRRWSSGNASSASTRFHQPLTTSTSSTLPAGLTAPVISSWNGAAQTTPSCLPFRRTSASMPSPPRFRKRAEVRGRRSGGRSKTFR